MYKFTCLIILLLLSLNVFAQPPAPRLHVDVEGLQVTLKWSKINTASGYRLSYASYPFQGVETIASIDLGSKTDFSAVLWQKAAFYVAVQAYDSNFQNSDYSNVGFVFIQDQGENYRQFWRTVSKEISEQAFIGNNFLYTQVPAVESCSAGTLSTAALLRHLKTFNEVRKLHQLSAVTYASSFDFDVQQAALIQRANDFLSHTPPENSRCFSQAGFNGSNSSNLFLASGGNTDPAENMIGFIDDAFNVSSLAGVGHRRALLNPFLQFTSYGQVTGASAIKVFDFSDSVGIDADTIPDFIAFPYLRYPYVFFSDKTRNKKTPWNLIIIEDKTSLWANQYNYFTDIELNITQKATGQLMQIDNLHIDTTATGIPNNLSWTVADWQYDTWYTVTVNNIRYRSGKMGSIQYDVLIDYKNIINITEPLELGDQQNNSSIQGTLFAEHDKDSYEINLDGTITFSGSSQFSNMAFFIAVYNADKQLLTIKDESFTLDLIAGLYTLVISNCNQQTCYSQSKNYSVQIN